MNARRTAVRLSALTVACVALWVITGALDFWPVLDASKEAKRHAAAHGLRMEGFLGYPVQESDGTGSCEVAIAFDDLASTRSAKLKLRRSWRFGGWRVTEMTIEGDRAERK